MNFIDSHFSKKQARTVIFAVTLGNLLEWYEIYLYVYWAPILSKIFFNNESYLLDLSYTFLIFAIGFLFRPLGGLILGRLGDQIGRRKTLILSILMMIIPTFVTGFLPTYATIGYFAPCLLALMRCLQSFPAGGEIPGAFCYLYESFPWNIRRYMCSWAVWGYQLGILISTGECFLLQKYLSLENQIIWGWRASFIVGGLLGLLGLFLRYRLHETPLFKEMKTHEKVVKEPILAVLYKHRSAIVKGILFCALNSSTFYLISVNFPVYFGQILGIDFSNDLLITICLLILMTLPLPLFGKLGDYFCNKKMLVTAVCGMIALLYPLYLAITFASIFYITLLIIIFCLFYTCTSALIPYIVADLFSTHDRFTCSAVSFNLADAILGGFTPFVALYLFQHTHNAGSFLWILLFGAVLSLIGFLHLKPRRTTPQ
jgi:MFS transporter, MHS family, proline/betaine transporter